MKANASMSPSHSRVSRLALFLCGAVLIGSLLLFFVQLGNSAFEDYDEATYASVINSTVSSGDLLTLSRDGTPWFEKPPLYFWAAIAAHKVFPDVEFAYRFPAALSGVVCVLLVMLITLSLTGNYYAAAFAGAMLLTTGLFLEAGRQVRLDVPVVMSILFAFYSFLKAKTNPKWYLGVGIGIAAGILIKSIIGAFIGVYIVIWAITERNFSWLKSFWFWGGALLSLALIVPWHIYESFAYGEAFWNIYFYQHVLNRYAENILGGTRISDLDYVRYSFEFAAQCAELYMIRMFVSVWAFWKKRVSAARKEIALLAIILFTYLVFLTAGTKILYYVIPALPFIAIFLAVLAARIFDRLPKGKQTLFTTLAALLVLGGIWSGIGFGFRYYSIFYITQYVANDEREIGNIIATKPHDEKVYAFNYFYWDTIHYYSGEREIEMMAEDQTIASSTLLVLPRATLDNAQFPDDLQKLMHTLYAGEAAALVEFQLK